jgi:excinuclease UvrABC nuclease subunit
MDHIIQQACQFLDINPKIVGFDWREIWTSQSQLDVRGVYIIKDSISNDIFYVGKGHVRERLLLHGRKVYGMQDFSNSWLNYVNSQSHKIVPGNWHVTYIAGNSETEMSALEGILLHKLKPLANDEVYLDKKIVETKTTMFWGQRTPHTSAYYKFKNDNKKITA